MPTSIGLAAHLAVAHLERNGIDPAPILALSGVSRGALASGQRIKVKSVIDFLERVSHALKDDWLGLTLGADFDLREIGLLYYVASSSQRFDEALKRLDRYERVANEAVDLRIVKGRGCRVELSYMGVPRHLDRHLMESFVVALLRLCRQLVGRKIIPLSASFVHHRVDGRKIQQFLGCDVIFDASVDDICFDASVYGFARNAYDPYLNDLMTKSCEEAVAIRTSNVSPFRTIVVENTVAPLLPHAEANTKSVANALASVSALFARPLTGRKAKFR